MAYKDKVNFKPHDFNNTVLTVDGDHNIQGLDTLEAEYTDDQFTAQTVADGTGILVKNNSRAGTLKFTMLESSPSSTKMWELYQAQSNDNTLFAASVKDASCPQFNVKETFFSIQKAPILKRSGEVDVVEWMLTAVYMEIAGGAYALQSA